MLALKAREAREIDKAAVTEAVALALHDGTGKLVSQSTEANPMKPGDYYLRPYVITKHVPASFLRRVFLRERERIVPEMHYGAVISCPVCGMPIMTSSAHRISSKSPLTIENPIACPYAAPGSDDAHSFAIKAGKIEPVNA